MNTKCTQCKFLFNESSVQANKRERLSLPILCQECFRIIMAESRAAKRTAEKVAPKKDSVDQLLEKLTKLYGQLSPSLLMRKLKLSYEEALKLSTQKNK